MTTKEYKEEIRRRDEIIEANKNIASEWLKMKGRLDMMRIAGNNEDATIIKQLISILCTEI
jgi:hypothetical protein